AGKTQRQNGLRTLKNQRPMYGYRFEGVRHDAGNKLGFLKATVEFALKREDLGGPFREYLEGLKLWLVDLPPPLSLVAVAGALVDAAGLLSLDELLPESLAVSDFAP